MKLTGWFSQDNKIADNNRIQTPDSRNTEQVSRQIRSLVPGQTLRGEIVSREGSNAQIRLLQDVLIDAKVDADIRLDLGQNITFQVKSNGQTLNLSPLFTNMAAEETVLKALDMASLPANESTVAMTKQLMDAGLPIDKNTLQQIWHESNTFQNAEILDIVNLHRLGLPVAEENISQMASYRNLTHQLTEGIADTSEALTDALQEMVADGDVEQAARLYQEITDLLLTEGEVPEASEAAQGENPEIIQTIVEEHPEVLQTEETTAENTGKVPDTATATKETAQQNLPGTADAEKAAPATETDTARLQNIQKLLQQGLDTKDVHLLRTVLQDAKNIGLPGKMLMDSWSMRPEDVASQEKVEQLYQKLGRQLKGLAAGLEESGQSGSQAYQAVSNLSQNVDFLQQINQTYAYIQLPLHLRQGEHKTGELFVYTNKRNLAKRDGQVSALLHLDMEHLGALDVYVAMQDMKVSTKFYVQNDAILDYLEANMDVLTERLKKRGYDCSCETTLRTELQQTAQAMTPILKTEGSVPIAQYAFDVRT